jgi:hypothetical protein
MTGPIRTMVPPAGIRSTNRFVQLGGAKIASVTGRPTFLRSMSNAATTSMSPGR